MREVASSGGTLVRGDNQAGPSLLRQCGHARRRHTLEAGLAIIVRLAWPGTLADLHVATVRKALDVGLAGERNGGGLRRGGPGRGGTRRWCGRITRLLRVGGLGRRISGLGLLRVLLLWILLLWILLRLLPRGGARLLIGRILPRLGRRRLFLVFAASPDEGHGCHA
jgi:hypothetical protein